MKVGENMRVKKFEYNGFYCRSLKGYAKYTAEFKEWTEDPGIAICICSDGIERLIPSCQLEGFDYSSYPEQKKTGLLFGVPSHS